MPLRDRVFNFVLAVAVLVTVYVIIKKHVLGNVSTSAGIIRWSVGVVFAAIAIVIVTNNLYLSLVRPLVYFVFQRDANHLRNVSGIPLLGSIAVIIAAVTLPANVYLGIALLVLFMIDPGGLLVLGWMMLWWSLFRPEDKV